MKNLILSLMFMTVTSMVHAIPVTLSQITGNAAHTETDSGEGVFRLTDTSVGQNDATAFLFLENAGFANVNAFGIVGAGLIKLEVFNGAASAITSATLAWDVNTNTVTNLATSATATIDDQLFGFYLDSGDGNTYFSITSMNMNNLDMMLSFDTTASGHPDLLGSDYVIAFEDRYNGDSDYNDLVVGISDIAGTGVPNLTTTDVPEPNPLALLIGGLGLLGMTRLKRK